MNTHAAPSEQSPVAGESLLNFTVEDITALRDRLLGVTAGDLRQFVAVRQNGAANDMLTTIYGAQLDAWHRAEGRDGDEAAALQYNGGLLYGKTLAKTLYQRQTGKTLKPNDTDAYLVALQAVQRSYVEIPDICQTQWEQENFREIAYTGSHLLSVLTAALDGHLTTQMKTLYAEYGMGDGIIDDSERVAFYRGLIDSVIFYNSYARWKREPSLPPQSFVEQATRLVADRQRRILPEDHPNYRPVVGAYSLDAGSDIADFVAHLDRPFKGTENVALHTDQQTNQLMTAYTGEVLRQIGPNTFVFMPEVIHQELFIDTPDDNLDLFHRIGRWGMAGLIVGGGSGLAAQFHSTEAVRYAGLAGSLAGTVVALGSLAYYFYKVRTTKF